MALTAEWSNTKEIDESIDPGCRVYKGNRSAHRFRLWDLQGKPMNSSISFVSSTKEIGETTDSLCKIAYKTQTYDLAYYS